VLLIIKGWKFAAQRGQATVQVGGDGSAGHAEHLGGGGGVQVKQDPQGDDLALPGWQPLHRGDEGAVQRRMLRRGCRLVMAG
jgi:hypothetical protein